MKPTMLAGSSGFSVPFSHVLMLCVSLHTFFFLVRCLSLFIYLEYPVIALQKNMRWKWSKNFTKFLITSDMFWRIFFSHCPSVYFPFHFVAKQFISFNHVQKICFSCNNDTMYWVKCNLYINSSINISK